MGAPRRRLPGEALIERKENVPFTRSPTHHSHTDELAILP